jgi:CRP/FNR family transcriptional regulator, cyclic AMP receptor protein
MAKKRARPFNTDAYLATAGQGRTIVHLKAKQIFSSQGDAADSLFYLRMGRAKLTIVSKGGKEATVTLLAPGDFFGEECMAGPNEVRTTSATAITVCVVLKIANEELTRGPSRGKCIFRPASSVSCTSKHENSGGSRRSAIQ